MANERENNGRENNDLDLIFRAVYGEKKGEVWDTDMHDVQNMFREHQNEMLSEKGRGILLLDEKGKIDISVFFKIENNPLFQAIEMFSNVFYLYDTQFVLHVINVFIKEYRKVNLGLIVNLELISEYKRQIYRIIITKLLAYLEILFIDFISKFDQQVDWLENWRRKRFYRRRRHIFLPWSWPWNELWFEILPTSVIDVIIEILNDYSISRGGNIYSLSRQDCFNAINEWKNELIIKLLSLEQDALEECRRIKHFLYLGSCFKKKVNLLYKWGNILKEIELNEKCIAITFQPVQKKYKEKEVWYAISGIDDIKIQMDKNYENKINDLCIKIAKLIHANCDYLSIVQYVRYYLNNNVLYYTKNSDSELYYSKFRDVFLNGKIKSICNKCLLKSNCSFSKGKKTEMINCKCKRMFTCCERKLFEDIGENKKDVIYTSMKTCELCSTVQQKKYPNIKLIYGEKKLEKFFTNPKYHDNFDPIAKEINSL